MPELSVTTEIDHDVLTLTLNRPEKRNAIDAQGYAEIRDGLQRAEQDPAVRIVVLRAAGRHFSAGVDLNSLQRIAEGDLAESMENARHAAGVLAGLIECSKPTVAVVQGAAYGGGVGLILACDIAVASETATFGLSELRLGLLPGLVAPLLAEAAGRREARRYLLTGQSFDAREALRIGLVHEVVAPDLLPETAAEQIELLRRCGPDSIAETKRFLRDSRTGAPTAWDVPWIADLTARHRASGEAREGVRAFLEKRPPSWAAGSD